MGGDRERGSAIQREWERRSVGGGFDEVLFVLTP